MYFKTKHKERTAFQKEILKPHFVPQIQSANLQHWRRFIDILNKWYKFGS